MPRCLCLPFLILAAVVASASPASADGSRDDYAVAAGHYAAQRWDLAIEIFTKFLADYPGHEKYDAALFYVGEAQVQTGDFGEARETFRKLLLHDPRGPYAARALFRRGEAAYLANDLENARTDLEQFEKQFPSDKLTEFTLPYLGEIALIDNRAAEASRYFTEALKQHPQGPLADDCQLGLAQSLQRQDRAEEAERIYRKLANDSLPPVADRANYRLGLLYYRGGNYTGALALWQAMDASFPDSPLLPKARLGCGWCLYRMERFGEAEERLASLVSEETVGVEAQYWLGMTLRAGQHWKQAAETLTVAAGAAEGHALAAAIHFHTGDSLLHVGDYDGAVRHFDAALGASPDGSWADDSLYGKLQAAHDTKDFNRVDALAGEFIERFGESPLLPGCLLLHASALITLEQHARAITPLAEFVNTNAKSPQAPAAYAELVTCYLKSDRLVDAQLVFDRMSADFAADDSILPTAHALAEAAYKSEDVALATQLFERLTADGNPDEIVAKGLAGLAWIALDREDTDRGMELFDRLLSDYPDASPAAEAALVRGKVFAGREDIESALVEYHRVIRDYPDSEELPEALLRAARIHDERGQDQQAVTIYTRLIDQHADFDQAHAAVYGRAWALLELGEVDRAYEDFARINVEARQSDYWADATYRLAAYAAGADQYERAASLLESLLASQPDADILAHALYLQGRVASRRSLWEQVEPPMSRLVRELPDSPLRLPAEYSIAEAAYQREQYDRAGRLLEALLPQIAGNRADWTAMVPLRFAQVMVHQEQWQRAIDVAELLAADYPNFRRMHEVDYLIGRSLAARGEFDSAREAYRKVVRSPTGSKTETAAMAQWMIGETYFHQQEFETARREYLRTEILYAYPEWQAAALLQAGKCLEQLGKYEQAANAYSRLLQKYPGATHANEAGRRLQIAQGRAAQPGLAPATSVGAFGS